MKNWPFWGLQTRVALVLAVVLVVFIVVTELTITRLTRVAMIRGADAAGGVDAATGDGGSDVAAVLLPLRRLILFYLSAGAVLVLGVGAFAVNRMVIRPLSLLNRGLKRVGEGRLDIQVPVRGARELVEIGGAFNRMTRELASQKAALEEQLQQIDTANRDLTAAQDRLIQAAKLASVGTLAAGVAHEIGNPLAGVLGLLEILERGDEPENAARYLSLMKSEIERIDRIISDLLSFARTPERSPSRDDAAEVSAVFASIRPLLRAQRVFDGVEIREKFSDERLAAAISEGDLTQLLLNLLLNAAEAIGGKGRIEIESWGVSDWGPPGGVVGDGVRIQITDDGPGVAPDDAGRIFDPFFTQKPPGKGTGLGLSICLNLCDRRGGEIILDSVYKSGARFTVTLPRAQA